MSTTMVSPFLDEQDHAIAISRIEEQEELDKRNERNEHNHGVTISRRA